MTLIIGIVILYQVENPSVQVFWVDLWSSSPISELVTKAPETQSRDFSPSPLRTQSIHAALHRTTDIKPWICYFPLCLSLTPFTQHVGSGKLLECLLCERKHVPGFIPGSIPGWGPSNIAGFSPGTSFVWTKARTSAIKADDVRYHVTLLPGVLKPEKFSQRKMFKPEWSRDQRVPHYPRWGWNSSPV